MYARQALGIDVTARQLLEPRLVFDRSRIADLEERVALLLSSKKRLELTIERGAVSVRLDPVYGFDRQGWTSW